METLEFTLKLPDCMMPKRRQPKLYPMQNGLSRSHHAARHADFTFHRTARCGRPPHLVRDYCARFDLAPGQTVLDSFSGTGTTVLEAKLNGIDAIGLEANPMAHFKPGTTGFEFARDEIVIVAKKLKVELPKNLGDVIYSFRYRAAFPASILDKAPPGLEWVIRPSGKALYTFAAVSEPRITPSQLLGETKIPDATPGIIAKYALTDEQALLARVRYNRLIDIFTGVVCYSLQSHLRTTVKGMGQSRLMKSTSVWTGAARSTCSRCRPRVCVCRRRSTIAWLRRARFQTRI